MRLIHSRSPYSSQNNSPSKGAAGETLQFAFSCTRPRCGLLLLPSAQEPLPQEFAIVQGPLKQNWESPPAKGCSGGNHKFCNSRLRVGSLETVESFLDGSMEKLSLGFERDGPEDVVIWAWRLRLGRTIWSLKAEIGTFASFFFFNFFFLLLSNVN